MEDTSDVSSEPGSRFDALTWAMTRLDEFIHAATRVHVPPPPGVIGAGSSRTMASDDEVVRHWAVVERILDRYTPDWRDRVQESDGYSRRGYRWRVQREGAQHCRAALEAESDLDRYLGPGGPALAAVSMHPWVWDAAKSAWEAGNYEDGLDAAARNVNSRTRSKVGRKDLGEGDLVAQLFSDKTADASNPRLRLSLPDGLGTNTERSIYAGIIAFGKGLFQAVRNPLAHEAPGAIAMTEQEALESLAALSLLARWIDRASVCRY